MSRSPTSATDADALLASAAKAEFAQDYDSAFAQYIKAASAHLALSRSIPGSGAERHKLAAARAVERAEKIKAAKGPAIVPVLRDPFAPGRLLQMSRTSLFVSEIPSEEQERVLRAGSAINGLSLPPLTDGADKDDGDM